MRNLIDKRDLRSLFTGGAVAVMSGLMLGGVMQPNLRADDRPEGPQILAGISAPRADRLYDLQASWASYQDRVPDYVVGTDSMRPPEQYAVLSYDERSVAPREETVVFTAEDEAPEIEVAARWEESPREPVSYPSVSGNVPTGADLPRPPAPPSGAEYEPVEITG